MRTTRKQCICYQMNVKWKRLSAYHQPYCDRICILTRPNTHTSKSLIRWKGNPRKEIYILRLSFKILDSSKQRRRWSEGSSRKLVKLHARYIHVGDITIFWMSWGNARITQFVCVKAICGLYTHDKSDPILKICNVW